MSQSSYSPVESLARCGRRFAFAYWLKYALDGGHPRLEVRTVLETVERLEPTFERVLHKVLGIIGVVGELHRLAVQRVDRGHGELLESRSRLRRGLVRLLFVGHAHYCMQDVR